MNDDDPLNPPPREDSWSRRQFTASLALAAGAAATSGFSEAFAAPKPAVASGKRKKVALIGTHVTKFAHAQHFVDRLLEGYGWEGQHHYPSLELVSLYIDQFPEGDLAKERAQRHNVKLYPSVAEALTLGGSKLAVDGVIIIGEHGKYPKNDKGQTLYPRYKWFKECVRVFEASSRSVPIFNDKHLSTDWKESVEMVNDARRLKFAFLAGSSLPITWRIPQVELPLNCELTESVSVCYGGIDSYDFHGLETAQCMSERRAGGEVGVKSIEAVKGDRIWEILAKRESTRDLLMSCLARSHTLSPPTGYTFPFPRLEPLMKGSPNATAYFIEHLDGFQTTMFLLNGRTNSVAGLDQKARDELWLGRSVRDFTYAGRLKSGETVSCKMHLPMPPWYATLADFFNPLMHHIERTIVERKAPYPIERTLLTTGMTAFAVDSLFRGEKITTPELNVAYQPAAESHFWRT